MSEKFVNIIFTQGNMSNTLIKYVKEKGIKPLLKSIPEENKYEVREVDSIENEFFKIEGTEVVKSGSYIFYYNENENKGFAGLIKVIRKRNKRGT